MMGLQNLGSNRDVHQSKSFGYNWNGIRLRGCRMFESIKAAVLIIGELARRFSHPV